MELYNPKTLLSLYGDGKMDVQGAIHQGLLHIDLLHQNQKATGKDRQELSKKIQQLEAENKQLRQKVIKIDLLENKTTALNAMLYQFKNEVDSLKAQLQSNVG